MSAIPTNSDPVLESNPEGLELESPAETALPKSLLAQRWALHRSETTSFTILDTAAIAGGIALVAAVTPYEQIQNWLGI